MQERRFSNGEENGSRAAQGAGTIRKKTVTRGEKEYTYWEARLTVGRDPGTGKQIQRSFSGKTQKEVREKLQAAAVEVNTGIYTPPQKMTVGQWLDIWSSEYLGNLKKNTVRVYTLNIRKHIKPAMGAIKLPDLRPHMVQSFINGLEDLSPASVRLAYKVLHMALEKAVRHGYLPRNPASDCVLPKAEQKEISPLNDEQTAAIIKAAVGSELEYIIPVALFTGLRLSEILGLTWDCIDLKTGQITVNKQLSRQDHRGDGFFISPKNGKSRTITPAGSVMKTFKKQKIHQLEKRFQAGPLWSNEHGLVFTADDGSPVEQWQVEKYFKEILDAAGIAGARFHDLRHTYAVNSIRAGDDIKTIQGNLGHSSAAFTLDRYGHFTERMKQDSADRMEGFIKDVLNL